MTELLEFIQSNPLVYLPVLGIFTEMLFAGLGFGGDKPEIPEVKPTDLPAEQQKALKANIAALPELSKLSEGLAKQRVSDIEQLFPGVKGLKEQVTGAISSMIKGELTPDEERFLDRSAAERAVRSGTAGSTFSVFDAVNREKEARGERVRYGVNSAQRWIDAASAQTPMNYASMMVTPQQMATVAAQNEQMRFNREMMVNQVEAMPSALDNAVMNFGQQFDSLVWQAAGTAVGGIGGGMFGGGGRGGFGSLLYETPTDFVPVSTPSSYFLPGGVGQRQRLILGGPAQQQSVNQAMGMF